MKRVGIIILGLAVIAGAIAFMRINNPENMIEDILDEQKQGRDSEQLSEKQNEVVRQFFEFPTKEKLPESNSLIFFINEWSRNKNEAEYVVSFQIDHTDQETGDVTMLYNGNIKFFMAKESWNWHIEKLAYLPMTSDNPRLEKWIDVK
ncbi:hypothetical protein J9303_14755 [Bacillaceae bacterium Marseille-Q3522]|nr:hypothetical protein [Bacillaceae bacterium Marseille-Q3522]